MDEYEFFSEVMDSILDYLPDEYSSAEVTMEQVTKNNDQVLHGLVIKREGETTVPIIYLEGYYGDLVKGKELEYIMDDIAKQYLKYREGREAFSVPDLNFDSIKGDLRVRLVNTTTNTELLRNVISKPVECGFSLVPYLDIQMGEGAGGMIQITKKMSESFGYDEKEIMKSAITGSLINTEPVLYRIEEVLFGSSFEPEPENLLQTVKRDDSLSGLMVLSNKEMELGSAALFFPGMQMRISEVIGDKDYYVLPSSVHELLVIPDTGDHNAKSLAKMVQDVNRSSVPPEERLGDKVLHYRADLERLSVAVDLEKETNREYAR